jgi:uncharacterized protein (TIGR02147 family)
MQTKSLLEYNDYKEYLRDFLDLNPKKRGSRSAMAKAIHCQSAYLSNVLGGHQHFTPEQGEDINIYLGHNSMESDYFLLLLTWARAGTPRLQNRIQQKMEQLKAERFNLGKRLDVAPLLTQENQVVYYSEWYYSAIHTLTSIPKMNSADAIAEALNLPLPLTNKALSFLEKTGLVKRSNDGFKIGPTRLHVGADSPLVTKHHMNWRLMALQSLQNRHLEDLHYSSVITLSEKDVIKIKESLLKMIKELKPLIQSSHEEVQYSLCFDFFKVNVV